MGYLQWHYARWQEGAKTMGAKPKYRYKVYDRSKEKNVLVDVFLQKVEDKLGIPKDKVIQYAQTGYVYNGQYLISRTLIDGIEEEEPQEPVRLDEALSKEWDRACLMLNPKARG